MTVEFFTEDNQSLGFINSINMPEIGKKLKFHFLENRDEIVEYEVIDAWYEVDKPSFFNSNVEIMYAKVTLKPVLKNNYES